VIANGSGRAVAFALAPGQTRELRQAQGLLACLPGTPKLVVADCGYTSHALREYVRNLGARPVVPAKANEAPVACPP
jgi:hypothetical protein